MVMRGKKYGSVSALALASAISFAACGAVPVYAKQMALIVGVSNYPAEMVGDLQLAGPKHDAALMIDTMSRVGFAPADMIVLADGLEETDAKRKPDGMPTKAAIMAALKSLADKAQAGDTVLVYLSGHGSQQPDVDPGKRPVPKPDGLDEIFLPLDIGPWQDAVQAVQNALPDYELGQAVNALRAKGALVWVVIDACHSGTMTRSAASGTVVKQVPPAKLGIPQAAFDKAKTNGTAKKGGGDRGKGGAERSWAFGQTNQTGTRSAGGLDGGYVAFFAAYPDQAAQQENLPKSFGPNPDKRPHGVLTFYLAQAMRSGHAATFKDLAHQILTGYGQFGAEAPTPMFEGDLATAFPGGGGNGPARFAAKRTDDTVSIEGGALDGIGTGALIGFATADDPQAFKGYGRVETTGAAKASVKLIAKDTVSAAAPDLPKDTVLVASLLEKGVDLSLRVGRPGGDAAVSKALNAALDAIVAKPAGGFTIEAVDAGQPADVLLKVEDGRIWLIPDNGAFEKLGRNHTRFVEIGGLDDPERLRKLIEPVLLNQAKVQNLLKVAATLGAGPVQKALAIEQYIVRDQGKVAAGARAPDDRDCAPASRDIPESAEKLAGDVATPALRQCDMVYFKISNIGDKPIDVTPLYIDGGGAIAYFGPESGLRLEPKAKPSIVPIRIKTFNSETGQPEPVGQERFLFIAVEVEGRQAFAANFAHLAQPSLTRAAASATPLGAFLDAAAFGGGKMRSSSAPVTGNSGIFSYRWSVTPPEGAQ